MLRDALRVRQDLSNSISDIFVYSMKYKAGSAQYMPVVELKIESLGILVIPRTEALTQSN